MGKMENSGFLKDFKVIPEFRIEGRNVVFDFSDFSNLSEVIKKGRLIMESDYKKFYVEEFKYIRKNKIPGIMFYYLTSRELSLGLLRDYGFEDLIVRTPSGEFKPHANMELKHLTEDQATALACLFFRLIERVFSHPDSGSAHKVYVISPDHVPDHFKKLMFMDHWSFGLDQYVGEKGRFDFVFRNLPLPTDLANVENIPRRI